MRKLALIVTSLILVASGCMFDGFPGVSPLERQIADEHGYSISIEDEEFMHAAEKGIQARGVTKYRVDVFGVPYRGGGIACTWDDAKIVRQEFAKRGASITDQVRAVYTVSRESGCRYWAYNRNSRTGDDSYCAAQLNRRAGWFKPGSPLANYMPATLLGSMRTCASAFADAWAACGWAPWVRGDYGCRPGSW